jgi:hypothetical protein
VELVQLDVSVAVRRAHQREGSTDILEANEAIDGGAIDVRLANQLESEFKKEGLHGFEVVDDDEEIVQSLDGHVPSIAEAVRSGRGRPDWRVGRGETRRRQGDEGAANLHKGQMEVRVGQRSPGIRAKFE